MKVFFLGIFVLIYNQSRCQHINIDSFCRNPLKYSNSRYLLIGENHNIYKNNDFYFSLIENNLIQGRRFSKVLLEMSQTDAMWVKMRLSMGDTLVLNNAFRYACDKEFYRKLYFYYNSKPLDTIPILGMDAIRNWRSSLSNLLEFSMIKLKEKESKELIVLIEKLRSLLEPVKSIKKDSINEIIHYILKNEYFLTQKDIFIAANSMKYTIEKYGIKKIGSYQRDGIMYNNLKTIDSLYSSKDKFLGIFGSLHLSNNIQKISRRKDFRSFVFLNHQQVLGRIFDIKTVVIYYPFQYNFYLHNKKKSGEYESLFECQFDSQLEERLKQSKKTEILPLKSCYDFALINIMEW